MADLVLVVDASSSVRTQNYKLVKRWMQSQLTELNIGQDGVQVALITFSTQAKVEFYLNTYKTKDEIDKHIEDTRYYRGSTNTDAALKVSLMYFSCVFPIECNNKFAPFINAL